LFLLADVLDGVASVTCRRFHGTTLRRPLSPNEEKTLCRLAHEGAAESERDASDVRRLEAFELIKTVDGRFVLTKAGRRRVDGLPLANDPDQIAYGEDGKALSQLYAWSRRNS
jgi:hypothetical protein